MPDLLIKEKELQQFYGIIDEIPTKFGVQILGFIAGVTKLRNQEAQQKQAVELDAAKKSLELAAAKTKLQERLETETVKSRLPHGAIDHSTFRSPFEGDAPKTSEIAKSPNPNAIAGQGPNGPETYAERRARVTKYLDHIGLGDDPSKQGTGCFPCEEAKGYQSKELNSVQQDALKSQAERA